MQIILIDDVFELGKRGEVVRVADGYGRNYLLPRKLAIAATPGNLKMVEQQRIAFAKKEAKLKGEAEILASELGQLHILISRKAGETGVLFGSVTAKDVADLLEQNGIHLDRRKVILPQPIKGIGNYKVVTHPHSEVEAELLVSVLSEGDQPLARVKKQDEETDRIVAELETKLKEIEQLTGVKPAPEAPAAEATERKGKRAREAAPAPKAAGEEPAKGKRVKGKSESKREAKSK